MSIGNYIFIYKNKIIICDYLQILLENSTNIVKRLIKRKKTDFEIRVIELSISFDF